MTICGTLYLSADKPGVTLSFTAIEFFNGYYDQLLRVHSHSEEIVLSRWLSQEVDIILNPSKAPRRTTLPSTQNQSPYKTLSGDDKRYVQFGVASLLVSIVLYTFFLFPRSQAHEETQSGNMIYVLGTFAALVMAWVLRYVNSSVLANKSKSSSQFLNNRLKEIVEIRYQNHKEISIMYRKLDDLYNKAEQEVTNMNCHDPNALKVMLANTLSRTKENLLKKLYPDWDNEDDQNQLLVVTENGLEMEHMPQDAMNENSPESLDDEHGDDTPTQVLADAESGLEPGEMSQQALDEGISEPLNNKHIDPSDLLTLGMETNVTAGGLMVIDGTSSYDPMSTYGIPRTATPNGLSAMAEVPNTQEYDSENSPNIPDQEGCRIS